jgi:hypothetical protein
VQKQKEDKAVDRDYGLATEAARDGTEGVATPAAPIGFAHANGEAHCVLRVLQCSKTLIRGLVLSVLL